MTLNNYPHLSLLLCPWSSSVFEHKVKMQKRVEEQGTRECNRDKGLYGIIYIIVKESKTGKKLKRKKTEERRESEADQILSNYCRS